VTIMSVHRRPSGATVLVAYALMSAVVLAGCTRGTQAADHSTGSTSSTSTTARRATPATTPTHPNPPVNTGYTAARAQWKAGATAISADQGKYWSQAKTDLINGETTDTNPAGYAHAVDDLTSLIALPDAQQTAAQNAEYHTDLNELNAFFNTPGLYS
jgi:hypothetical protein